MRQAQCSGVRNETRQEKRRGEGDVKHEGEGNIYHEAVMVQCKEKRKGKKRAERREM